MQTAIIGAGFVGRQAWRDRRLLALLARKRETATRIGH